ncbi:hypothetical protein GEV43_22405 [Actinomadura sp. J1-007]|nr:hypothetical protein [Actinomadura sp. J1-007]MWK36525.1 hypothetical protein [Actinomadura sp. J1-007]
MSASNLPPDVPPLTNSTFNPLGGMRGPQVALPPVASPQLAPSPMPLVPVSSLRKGPRQMFTMEELSSVQAGFLAAMTVSVTLLLLRLRLARRADPPLRRAGRVQLQLAGKRITEARLRTLPPQPAPARPVRIAWLPLRPPRAARP